MLTIWRLLFGDLDDIYLDLDLSLWLSEDLTMMYFISCAKKAENLTVTIFA